MFASCSENHDTVCFTYSSSGHLILSYNITSSRKAEKIHFNIRFKKRFVQFEVLELCTLLAAANNLRTSVSATIHFCNS